MAEQLGLERTALSTPLESTVWYRVADLRPKLRAHARLHRHRYRGKIWYLLEDPASGRVNRFSPAARLIIALMDGTRRVSELWEAAQRRQGETAPTQDEMIQLLGQLHGADLLQTDVTPDVAELFDRGERESRARAWRTFGNPMAIRLPLWDPDRLLNRIRSVTDLVWSRTGLVLWLAVVLPAVVLIPPHWPELSNNFTDRVLAVDNLFILYLVFPILKALHEMGHATAIKARGGAVHDLGLIFLVMLPVPYVEASAAITFKSKFHRAAVGSAGVAVELFVAALAFYVWLLVEPGVVRAALFNTMLIAGVSTLIFNGNPLLRYDAYYVLADLIEMPNLAGRSQRYWRWVLERVLFGIRDASPEVSRGEQVWLLAYGAASTLYRMIVTIFIALFIAGRFFFIGVVLAIWAVAMMAVLPAIRLVGYLARSPRLNEVRGRALAVGGGGALLLAAFLIVVPVPDYTYAQGIVWLSDQSLVRANASGFLTGFLTAPGAHAATGDRLAVLAEPELTARIGVSQGRLAELEAAYMTEASGDRVKAEVARQQVASERANLAALRQREVDLTVLARTDGEFVAAQGADMPGRFYHRGDLLGWVLGAAPPLVRVVVPQDAVDRVRLDVDRVRVRRLDQSSRVVDARIVRIVPGGEEYLPSRALSAENGGDIPTDPRDTKGPRTMQRTFQFDVELNDTPGFNQFGQRVMVRFEHPSTPFLLQVLRSVRLLFLSRFSI